MQAQRNDHGPYRLVPSLLGERGLGGDLIIQRQDADRKRTVGLVDSREHWDRFVLALETGAEEVEAVHAIDDNSTEYGIWTKNDGGMCEGPFYGRHSAAKRLVELIAADAENADDLSIVRMELDAEEDEDDDA